jgi:hypothetical protein
MRKDSIAMGAAALGVVAVLVWSAGCGVTDAAAEQREPVVLETYKVPQGLESDVRSMLHTVMGGSESPVGRVTSGPGGTIVVVAPESLHAGVERLIAELAALDAPAQPVPVELTYWFVVGRPVPDLPAGHRTAPGSKLEVLAPVLEEIAQSQGPMEFRLLERLELASMGEIHATLSGTMARVQQRALVVQDNVVADLQINVVGLGGVETRVKLKPEQFLVLGQSGYRDPSSSERGAGTEILFYVISTDVES